MRLQSKYDWVVLGDHPAALLSGSLLTRLGYSVLFLQIFPSTQLTIHSDGRWVDPESSLLFGIADPDELEPGVSWLRRAIREAIGSEADLFADQEVVVQKLDPLSRHRWVAPQATSAGAQLWNRLAERPWLTPKPKFVPPAARSSDLPSIAVSWTSAFHRTLGERLHASGEQSGFWLDQLSSIGRVSGGMRRLRDRLLEAARIAGAHEVKEGNCTGIAIQDGRWVGVQVSGRRETFAVQGGCAGVSLTHLVDTLPQAARAKTADRSPRPSRWLFTVAFGVAEHGRPVGSGDFGYWLDPQSQIPVEWEWRRSSEVDSQWIERGSSAPVSRSPWALHLRAWLPFDAASVQVESLARTGLRLERLAREIFPFLDEHIQWKFPDPLVPAELSQVYGFISEELIPENLRLYAQVGTTRTEWVPWKDQSLGYSSGIQGLFVASQESSPPMGPVGPFVAALTSVLEFSKMSGLAEDSRLQAVLGKEGNR